MSARGSFLLPQVKNICVRRDDTANECIAAALKVLDQPELRPGDLQLWVRTKANESPYPLIGHEIPLVIKMHWMKKTFEGQNQKSYEDYKQGTRCSFILRYVLSGLTLTTLR